MLKISVVTASYNQAKFIEECLQSVKKQNYPALEHIVVDGASTDGTVEILRRYSSQPGWDHLHWVSESDRGQSDALNKGFRMATGEIVGWLNSDDRYRRGCFQVVVQCLNRSPQTDILYGDYTWIDESGRLFQIRREIEFSRFVLSFHRVLYIATTATFFRRRIFDDGNFLDPRFHYAMDYEFFLRLVRGGYQFQHIPHLLADFRWHPNSKSASEASKQFEEHDRIARTYSPLLSRVPSGLRLRLLMGGLRALAAGSRYVEKLCRGHYFEQFRVGGTSLLEQ